ncbi:MAG: hypothetical protein NT023_18265 [Armatimonadetes bacterium]|nr:hypothetical protein [Armatimonadota bacterium]
MIRLPSIALPPDTQISLEAYQNAINALPTYVELVERAKTDWKRYNVKGDSIFDSVKLSLDAMCSGVRRCGYCEDSMADEVEHIYPKNIYPNRAFLWENYLYSCGACNSPKSDRFEIFRESDGKRQNVQPKRKEPRTVSPPDGSPVLIDPRHENPMDYLILDMADTFFFQPIAEKGTEEWVRADYTRRVLHLNDRDSLIRARKSAFSTCQRYIGDYIRQRDRGEPFTELSRRFQREVYELSHISVWKEIQRQHQSHPALCELFRQAPEALNW